MARYEMDCGSIVDTEKAIGTWNEYQDWDGRNFISSATGSQWEHEKLYKSRRGRYYIESWSQRQGSRARAEWASKERAAAWLLMNKHKIPDDLAEVAESIVE